MKTRSEIMQERAAKAAAEKKSSAAERTVAIPGTEDLPEQVHCPECNLDMRTKDLEKRDDGSYECSTCGMPLKPSKANGVNGAVTPVPKSETKPKTEKKSEEPKPEAPKRDFSAIDPKYAFKPPIEGHETRLSSTWGKAIFPVGDMLSLSKFSNMEIGPFFISMTADPNKLDEAEDAMTAELKKMADKSFIAQLAWFKEKLGLIK